MTMNDNDSSELQQSTIGDNVVIKFASLGDKDVKGKVDTGATTSSMHATDIQPNGNQISFVCPYLSDNAITMDLDGSQDVVSADGGNNKRPMIKLDISVDGVELQGISFNLNDRSEMDCPILVGQNIIKSGNFIIDLNRDSEISSETIDESISSKEKDSNRNKNIMDAVKILKDNNVTIFELVEFLRTAPLYLRSGDNSDNE